MNIPHIQIRTTDAQLGLNIADAKQVIRQPRATQHIEQPAAILEMHTTRGIMRIDSTQARRDVGLISPAEFTSKYASEARQKAMQGIARRASEGRQMMEISKDPNAIATIAKQNTFPTPAKLGIDFIPSVGSVKLDYTPAKLDINAQEQKAKISAQVNKPVHEYTPGKVSGYMIQHASIDIDVIG
ncbi:DUF6470 family protein [Psychrobacillus sp.]|uniref:DUF6470 family protein n=1 Tax=Psychrobacillus sp. TaxID=1871623 RepID=UPI0028BE947B|nr:DUF6470 family protein [Psychrobacillus sp.]